MVAVPSASIMHGRLVDVSLGGVSMMLPEQLRAGQQYNVAFDPSINGKVRRIVAKAKVVYCILSGSDGFRVGFQFVQLDTENNKAVAELML